MAIAERPPVGSDEHRALVKTAEASLLDPSWSHIVEMVLSRDGDTYEAAAVDGRSRFRRAPDGEGWRFEVVSVEGRDPLGDQATDRFSPLVDERSTPYPHRTENAYPNGHLQVSQLFDSPAAPDLCVRHGSIEVVCSLAELVPVTLTSRTIG